MDETLLQRLLRKIARRRQMIEQSWYWRDIQPEYQRLERLEEYVKARYNPEKQG